jgi:hypothetical protein
MLLRSQRSSVPVEPTQPHLFVSKEQIPGKDSTDASTRFVNLRFFSSFYLYPLLFFLDSELLHLCAPVYLTSFIHDADLLHLDMG